MLVTTSKDGPSMGGEAAPSLSVSQSAPKFSEYTTPPPPGYLFDSLIGEGSFAEVFLAHSDGSSSSEVEIVCAIKAISKLACPPASIQAEVESLQRCSQHPSIESFPRVIQTDEFCYIITEYCTGGELFDVLSKRVPSLNMKQGLW